MTNDILANLWYAAFVDQQARPEIDLVPTATMALQYINFSHQVRAAAARWHDGSVGSVLADSKGYLDEALAAQRTGPPSRIIELAEKARRLDETFAEPLVSDNEAKYSDVRAEEAWWGGAFEMLYLCGAALVGGSFIVAHRKRTESSPEFEID